MYTGHKELDAGLLPRQLWQCTLPLRTSYSPCVWAQNSQWRQLLQCFARCPKPWQLKQRITLTPRSCSVLRSYRVFFSSQSHTYCSFLLRACIHIAEHLRNLRIHLQTSFTDTKRAPWSLLGSLWLAETLLSSISGGLAVASATSVGGGARLMEQPLLQCWWTNSVPPFICIFSMDVHWVATRLYTHAGENCVRQRYHQYDLPKILNGPNIGRTLTEPNENKLR